MTKTGTGFYKPSIGYEEEVDETEEQKSMR